MSEFGFETHPLEPPLKRPPSGSNALGLTGFILSLVGLVTCGCFAPLGLLFSLIGVFRRPRGLAIAGLVISAAGLLELAGIALLVILGVFSSMPSLKDGFRIAPQIESYRQAHNGAMPTAWSDLPGVPAGGPTDHWGHPYHYTLLPDGRRVELLSDGPDGLPGTADDVHVQIDGGRVWVYVGRPPPWLRP